MKIVNMKNFFISQGGWTGHKYLGFGLMNEEGKFLSMDGLHPYTPAGGRKALAALVPIADRFQFIALQ